MHTRHKLNNALLHQLVDRNDFRAYLLRRNQAESCGITQKPQNHPFGIYLGNRIRIALGIQGLVDINFGIIAFQEFEATNRRLWILQPRWLRCFNRCLNAYRGGESDEITPYTCLRYLDLGMPLKEVNPRFQPPVRVMMTHNEALILMDEMEAKLSECKARIGHLLNAETVQNYLPEITKAEAYSSVLKQVQVAGLGIERLPF